MPMVGFLNWGSPAPNRRLVAALRQALAQVGYINGQNVTLEFRWAEGDYTRLPTLAAELVPSARSNHGKRLIGHGPCCEGRNLDDSDCRSGRLVSPTKWTSFIK